ncbi:hypothetical protein RJ55_08255 [Drechmeria coniospora]|nr:hypothetical protein RJ55_08255 [Drechmeria coniospora]
MDQGTFTSTSGSIFATAQCTAGTSSALPRNMNDVIQMVRPNRKNTTENIVASPSSTGRQAGPRAPIYSFDFAGSCPARLPPDALRPSEWSSPRPPSCPRRAGPKPARPLSALHRSIAAELARFAVGHPSSLTSTLEPARDAQHVRPADDSEGLTMRQATACSKVEPLRAAGAGRVSSLSSPIYLVTDGRTVWFAVIGGRCELSFPHGNRCFSAAECSIITFHSDAAGCHGSVASRPAHRPRWTRPRSYSTHPVFVRGMKFVATGYAWRERAAWLGCAAPCTCTCIVRRGGLAQSRTKIKYGYEWSCMIPRHASITIEPASSPVHTAAEPGLPLCVALVPFTVKIKQSLADPCLPTSRAIVHVRAVRWPFHFRIGQGLITVTACWHKGPSFQLPASIPQVVYCATVHGRSINLVAQCNAYMYMYVGHHEAFRNQPIRFVVDHALSANRRQTVGTGQPTFAYLCR